MFKLFKKLFSKIYLNKDSNISTNQYQKNAISALYSEQQGVSLNSLTTGLGEK